MSRTVGDYNITRKLGSGSFASVFKAHHCRYPDKIVAIKAISTAKLNKKLQDNLTTEIGILQKIEHENVVRLYGIQKSERHIYLIMEYCDGGDLHRFIRKHGRLSVDTARHFMHQLGEGMRYLWSKSLIHRDLKPQNLLLSTYSENARLKIADFGFARHLAVAAMAETLCGSPLYMAPEILKFQKYDAKADLWSAGAILFEMMTGKPPFHGSNPQELLRNIEKTELMFSQDILMNPDCKSLIQQLLRKNPVERVSFEEFFRAKFIVQSFQKLEGDGVDLEHSSISEDKIEAIARSENVGLDKWKESGGSISTNVSLSTYSESTGTAFSGLKIGNSGKGIDGTTKLNSRRGGQTGVESDEAWELVSNDASRSGMSETKTFTGFKHKAVGVASSKLRSSVSSNQRREVNDSASILRYIEKYGDIGYRLGLIALNIEEGSEKLAWDRICASVISIATNERDNEEEDLCDIPNQKSIVFVLLSKSVDMLHAAIELAKGIRTKKIHIVEAAEAIVADFQKYAKRFDARIRCLLQENSEIPTSNKFPRASVILYLGLAFGQEGGRVETEIEQSPEPQNITNEKLMESCEMCYSNGLDMFRVLASEKDISPQDLRLVREYISVLTVRLEKVKILRKF